MKKRFLSIFLTISVIIGLFFALSLTSSAAESVSVSIGGIALSDGDYLVNGATAPTKDIPAEGIGYAHLTFGSNNDLSLELNNFEYNGSADGIHVENSTGRIVTTTVTVIGENKINTAGNYGIYTNGKVTITGNGKLSITAKEAGIWTEEEINIGTSSVSLITINVTSSSGYGIYSGRSALISRNIDIQSNGYGIFSNSIISIHSDDMKIEAAESGIRSGENALISITSASIKSGDTGIYAESDAAIYCLKDIEIEAQKNGIQANGVSFTKFGSDNNVNVTVNIDAGKSGFGYGIYSENSVSFVYCDKVNINAPGYGIYAKGDVSISDGEIKIKAESTGIYVSSGHIKISDSDITINEGSYGIYALSGSIEITDSDIEIDAGYTGLYGFYALHGNITVSDSDITINEGSYGFYAYEGNIEIRDSDIEIDAGSTGLYGIYVSRGNIEISGGEIEIDAGSTGSYGIYASSGYIEISDSDIEIDAGYEGIYASHFEIRDVLHVLAGSDLSNAVEITDPNENISWCQMHYIHIIPLYPIIIGDVELKDGDYLVNGATETTKTQPTEGGYAYYKDGVLTLNNYVYNAVLGVYSNENINIVLVGDNSITSKDHGIFTLDGDIKISGNGSLEINTSSNSESKGIFTFIGSIEISGCDVTVNTTGDGIYATQGDVTINGGNVTVDATEPWDAGIYAKNNITIDGNVTVNAGNKGIFTVDGNVTINGGTITINAESNGIYAPFGHVTIDDTLHVYAGDNADSAEYIEDHTTDSNWKQRHYINITYPLYIGGIEIKYGEYLASGAEATTKTQPTEGGYAYYKDGVLTLYNYENNSSPDAVSSNGDIKIELIGNNTLSADEENSKGIYSESGNIEISGDGNLSINANYGIYADDGNVTISGGNITINAGSNGIYASSGNITIDGDIEIDAKSGIYAVNGDIEISGGDIEINAGLDGIYAYGGDITIDGGTITIKTTNENSIGIYAYDGNVEISGGRTEITSVMQAISGSQIDISDSLTIIAGDDKESSKETDNYVDEKYVFILIEDSESANPTDKDEAPSNKFEQIKIIPTEVTLGGIVEMIGDHKMTAEEFAFDLYTESEYYFEKDKAPIQTVKNELSGEFKFEPVEITTPGVHKFVIKQNLIDMADELTYDRATFRVSVDVQMNGNKLYVNEINIFRNYDIVESPAILFENIYLATPLKLTFGGETDNVESEIKLASEFGKVRTATVNEDGTFEFVRLNFNKAGVYNYTVTEKGSETVYTIKVTIKDDGKGTLTAETVIEKQGEGVVDGIKF